MSPSSDHIIGGRGLGGKQSSFDLHSGMAGSPQPTGPIALETMPAPLDAMPGGKSKVRFSLFWRTFFLLSVLLVASVVAWLQTYRALEGEPRAAQTAQQIASIVNLSRAALVHSDAIARVSLIKQLAETEGVRISVRQPQDTIQSFGEDAMMQSVLSLLRSRLGPDTTLARGVNGQSGLWVGFQIEQERFWLQTDLARFSPVSERAWLIWLSIAGLLSLAGAALIARLINRPLKALSFAASRLKDGNFDASRLSEDALTSEIREVNQGFNRMAAQLSKMDQDRAVMLAGISHDLRTPLARLRLETEMSVQDEAAREHMVADLEQLDAIIDKFLDYARPTDQQHLRAVALNDVIEACVLAIQHSDDFRVKLDLPEDFHVLSDEVELTRVITNLVENARKYGKTANTGITELEVAARQRQGWVFVKVRDHGPGVSEETLRHMTKPFFRGDVARTAATGAGLGLAIVEKTIQRLGGSFSLHNSSTGGLAANIRLPAFQAQTVDKGSRRA